MENRVKIFDIHIPQYNVRANTEDSIELLRKSIKKNKQVTPVQLISVPKNKLETDKKYIVIDGSLRLKAMKQLGLKTVKAVIDGEVVPYFAIENFI